MENMVYPRKGESRYIAFDHSPPGNIIVFTS